MKKILKLHSRPSGLNQCVGVGPNGNFLLVAYSAHQYAAPPVAIAVKSQHAARSCRAGPRPLGRSAD